MAWCPVDGCCAPLEKKQVVCAEHWRSLPGAVREHIFWLGPSGEKFDRAVAQAVLYLNTRPPKP